MANLKKLKALILDNVPADGQAIGNGALIKILGGAGYSKDQYWKAHDQLVAEGVLAKGVGKGGAVKRTGTGGIQDAIKPDTRISSNKRELLLSLIPEDGATIGNKMLMHKLAPKGISVEEYWEIRNELITEGILSKGRGMGGSVFRTDKPETTATTKPSAKKFPKEKDLYKPFEAVLKQFWLGDNGLSPDRCAVEITAQQGGRTTGGKWTRPDISILKFPCSVSSLKWLFAS